MGTRKLKPVPQKESVGMPEALDLLPTPLLMWDKSNQELWANSEFVKQYGPVEQQQFDQPKPVHALNARPITLDLFSNIGRHEGFVLKGKQNNKITVDVKVGSYGKSNQENFVVMIDEVDVKAEIQEQLVEAHLQLQHHQRALIQAEKLASLGEMSSSIAHELNQPLQAIMGFSQELTQTEKLSPQGMEFLNDIHGAAIKMREIIKSLRTFAREAGDQLTPTSVETAALEAIKLTHHQFIQRNIQIEFVPAKHLPKINANPIQLEQVIINLLNNARDAIEETGRKDGKVMISICNTKAGVVFKLQDNGCGMNDETKDKIFNPFFTTKEIGKGTGLGLSISYGIIKKFDADIQVTSQVNKGTIFTLTFKPIERGN